jgi:hypothetical protein
MPTRRSSLPPPPEIKQFTSDEIARGIAKLNRRIEEVKSLDPRQVSYDDQLVRNVEHSIDATILEIFGHNSPEYRRHQHHNIWHEEGGIPGTFSLRMGPPDSQQCFAAGIPQTVTLLNDSPFSMGHAFLRPWKSSGRSGITSRWRGDTTHRTISSLTRAPKGSKNCLRAAYDSQRTVLDAGGLEAGRGRPTKPELRSS